MQPAMQFGQRCHPRDHNVLLAIMGIIPHFMWSTLIWEQTWKSMTWIGYHLLTQQDFLWVSGVATIGFAFLMVFVSLLTWLMSVSLYYLLANILTLQKLRCVIIECWLISSRQVAKVTSKACSMSCSTSTDMVSTSYVRGISCN
jgi:hypothetical protein